jgi:putative MATE family efflux protein
MQALFNITDVAVYGHFGDAGGTAGIGIGGQIIYLITSFITGLATGATILVAKYKAKNELKKVKETVFVTAVCFLMLSVAVSVLLFIFAKPLLVLLKTPVEALATGADFVKFSAPGIIFTFALNLAFAYLRGMGNSIAPMLAMVLAVLINLGLDILFVAVFKMDGLGIALASIIAQAVATGFALIVIIKKHRNSPRPSFASLKSKASLARTKEFLKIGSPVAVANFVASLSFVALTFLVNYIFVNGNVDAQAAHSVAIRYNGFAQLPARAMASAIAAITAQNIGAGKYNRTKPTFFGALAICLIFGVAVCVFSMVFPNSIYKVLGADASTAQTGKVYMMLMSLDYIILPLCVCIYGVIDGAGKTGVTMFISVLVSVAARVPLAFLLAKVFGMNMAGIGFAIPLTSLFAVLIVWAYLLIKTRGKPLSKEIAD